MLFQFIFLIKDYLLIRQKKIKDQTAGSEKSDLNLHFPQQVWVNPYLEAVPLYQTTNFRLSQNSEFVDDKLKFDENGEEKFSQRLENAAGKGEIARYEQFFLFPQCFQKTCTTHTHVTTRVCLGKC